MKNIEIKLNRRTSMVYLDNTILGNEGENLQGDIIFSFSDTFVNGQARLEYEINGETKYIPLTKNEESYRTPIKSVLTKPGTTNMQVVITENETESGIPIFKSNKFYLYCNDSLNAEIEQPEEYPQWIDKADSKLNEIDTAIEKVNNLDIEAVKKDNVLTVTIYNIEGTGETFEIYDGVDGAPGKDGKDGLNGKDGQDGYTPVKGVDYFDGKNGSNGRDGVDGKDYVITDKDYQAIGAVVETNIQPTLEENLKDSKDYVDNAIIKDIKNVSYNQSTGTFTFTRHDNTTLTVDLPIEQTVKDGRYDENTNELVLVLVSGQEIKIPVSGLIDDYDGIDTATIQCVVSADNKITCNIKSGSISKTLLTTDLQNEITNKVNKTSFVYDEETETLSISI